MSISNGMKSILKRIVKWAAIVFGGIIVLIIAAGIVAMIIIDKPFIENQMEKQLHRQSRIGDLSGGLFSAVSGFTVKDVKISNFKSVKELESLKGKPVADSDIFASMKSFNFRISIPPVITGKIVLKELMLYSPRINIVRYNSGAFNFSDLLVSKPMTPEEKAELEKKMREEAEKPKEESKPFKADDIPVAINVGSLGMQDGDINFSDQSSGQKLNIYKITAKVYDISIDPKNLEKNDNISLKIAAGIKTLSRPESGSVQSFDIGLDVKGMIIPFDKKTKTLNPEISVKAGSPYGKATGLQIFNEMINVEQLSKYSGKFDFLKKEINWKNGFVSAHYKNNVVSFRDGKIANDDYTLLFNGNMNIATSVVDIDADLSIAKKHSETVKKRIVTLASKAVKGKAAKFVTPVKIADIALKPLLNDKGEIFLKEKIKGNVSKPNADLVSPKLSSIDDVVKEAVKEAGGEVIDAAKDKAKDKAKKEAAKQTDKAKSKAGSKIKGLIK